MPNEASLFTRSGTALSEEEKGVLQAITDQIQVLEQMYRIVSEGRRRSLALTALEDSYNWIVAALNE